MDTNISKITIDSLRQSYIDRTIDDVKRALAYIAILGGSPADAVKLCLDEISKISNS